MQDDAITLARPHRAARRTIVAHDVDEQAHNLTDWEQRYDQITAGRFCGVLDEWRNQDVQIFRERNSCALHQACSVRPDAFWFGIEAQTRGMRINGRPVGDDRVMTRPGHHPFELMTPDAHEILGIVIQRSTLLAAAEQQRCVIETSRLASAELLQVDHAALQTCRQTIQALLAMDEPAAALAAQADHVISALLALLDTSAPETEACASLARRRRIVRDAHEYVLSHQDVTVTVPMLCEQLYVSRRTLQYCFGDVLGISPMAYLRYLRLNEVRRQLTHAAGAEVRVGDVAAAWGFKNFSQFSCDYKKLFGASPSSALKLLA
ncbi:helix-turn-helix domain-containing protein [Amantichitinum ursilacus]|uniref:Transcriptional regulator EutR n=1 Tax=Amantichitinum ursilacus TaxID=857265 RepID=A0A0N0XM09_9NEIS|nr:helix-turn-helix domain-containing protein [Amantichitinum ursilacus]KPC53768.1 transcriptional regulator EutR [Amantichitinum ursilacus]